MRFEGVLKEKDLAMCVVVYENLFVHLDVLVMIMRMWMVRIWMVMKFRGTLLWHSSGKEKEILLLKSERLRH
jgi:hypothetical protein